MGDEYGEHWMIREAAARHRIDPRTLVRAIREGLDAIRGFDARARAARALRELGYEPSSKTPRSAA